MCSVRQFRAIRSRRDAGRLRYQHADPIASRGQADPEFDGPKTVICRRSYSLGQVYRF